MARIPKTPLGMYNEINRRYFSGELPENVSFIWVEDYGLGEHLDARCEEASVVIPEDPKDEWVVSLNAVFRDPSMRLPLYTAIIHECIHIHQPECNHGDKVWNREIRRLAGLGLLRRIL